MMKYNTVVIFVIHGDEILMLNRNKHSWMGMWNSVGGKIENGETPIEAAIRETYEETGIKISENNFNYLADLNWFFEEDECGGSYCYLAYTDEKIATPLSTREGILEWKKIDWVLDKRNRGIVPDIFLLLTGMLSGTFKEINAYYDKNDILYNIVEVNGK